MVGSLGCPGVASAASCPARVALPWYHEVSTSMTIAKTDWTATIMIEVQKMMT